MISNITQLENSARVYTARQDARCVDRDWDDEWLSSSKHTTLSNRIDDEISRAFSVIVSSLGLSKSLEERERYGRFLQAQFAMHSSVRSLYDDPILRGQFPQLVDSDSVAQIRLALADIGMREPSWPSLSKGLPSGHINRLGWLYIAQSLVPSGALWLRLASELQLSETVNIRHWSERSKRWSLLAAVFDDLCLSEIEEERIFAGARSAIGRFAKLINRAFDPRIQQRVGLIQ